MNTPLPLFQLHRIKFSVLAVFVWLVVFPLDRVQAAELIVTVTNLAVQTGTMKAAIFDQPTEFPRGKKTDGTKAPARNKAVRLVFKGLTPGKRYAIAVYHDENGNDKFDKAFLSIPLEGFGFSRDASVLGGAPDFKDADFVMKGERMEITIKLKHSVFD